MNQKQLLFSLKGRIGRAEWWTASVILMLLQLCIGFAFNTAFGVSPFDEGTTMADLVGPPPIGATLASFGLAMLVAWPHLALNVKRLHDRDIPAWPAVVLTAVIVLSAVRSLLEALGVSLAGGGGGPLVGVAAVLLGLGLLIFCAGVLVVMAFLDGTRGPNRHGPSPKDLEPATA